MLFSRNHRISMTIKDHVIRYVYATSQDLDSIKEYGQRFLPYGVIREGKIIERETLAMFIEECLESFKSSNKSLYFTVPDAYTVIRPTFVPQDIPDKEVKGYLSVEIGNRIKLPFDQPAFDIQITGKAGDQKEVLLIASSEETVNDYRNVFEEIKLKPKVADLSSISFYRFCDSLGFVEEAEHVFMIQFDISATNITIFDNGRPLFTRNIKSNLDPEFWQVEENRLNENCMVWTGKESTIDSYIIDMQVEIERLMNFYRFSLTKGKNSITKFVLGGDHPYLHNLDSKLSENYQIPIVNIHEQFLKKLSRRTDRNIKPIYADVYGLVMKPEV